MSLLVSRRNEIPELPGRPQAGHRSVAAVAGEQDGPRPERLLHSGRETEKEAVGQIAQPQLRTQRLDVISPPGEWNRKAPPVGAHGPGDFLRGLDVPCRAVVRVAVRGGRERRAGLHEAADDAPRVQTAAQSHHIGSVATRAGLACRAEQPRQMAGVAGSVSSRSAMASAASPSETLKANW